MKRARLGLWKLHFELSSKEDEKWRELKCYSQTPYNVKNRFFFIIMAHLVIMAHRVEVKYRQWHDK